MPTTAGLKAAKEKIQYKDGEFHFAVADVVGSGKSSLINALCGMSNQDPNAAPTGIVETTLEVGRYTNPSHADHFAWYDVPGSGTLKIPDWQYFNSQGLTSSIASSSSSAIADQHIRNLMKEMGYDSDDEGETEERMYKAACGQFIAETHRSIKENLQEAQLPDQRVYIVSHKSVLGIVRDKTPKRTIDELELLRDLHNEGYKSRKHSFDVPNGAYTAAQSL
ncbi:P-loop containing nucleoside triphosphate hydrolase protein [Boletus edulis]|nr:P-loop containing nucleoside triphosphate hydrolase protein [Boletus edulis]